MIEDDDILDLLDDRPPRNPMDEVSDNTSNISDYAWTLQKEVSNFTAIASERHDELIAAIYSARDGSIKVKEAVERGSFVLWVIAGLLGYIAYHLK